MDIRPATTSDADAIAAIILPTFQAGQTYAIDPAITRAAALDYWLAPGKETFIAQIDGETVGTYYLRANQPGGGSHVANCGYMTGSGAAGKGVASRMCEHSLNRARERGFRAMQFNFVVSTNERAVALWQRLGFAIAGRLPGAFLHPQHGYVDALVMHRHL